MTDVDEMVPAAARRVTGIRHCTYKDCKSRNAANARFCRVCGRKFTGTI
jgi:hypothetical protein